MQVHKLTSADAWFIEKGQIDALSRSPFHIGDEVVVCDKQHVMLAEFYDGECLICHSRNTVPFSRQSVESGVLRSYVGKCPRCAANVTVLFRQSGAGGPFVGICPKCNRGLSVQKAFLDGQAQAPSVVWGEDANMSGDCRSGPWMALLIKLILLYLGFVLT